MTANYSCRPVGRSAILARSVEPSSRAACKASLDIATAVMLRLAIRCCARGSFFGRLLHEHRHVRYQQAARRQRVGTGWRRAHVSVAFLAIYGERLTRSGRPGSAGLPGWRSTLKVGFRGAAHGRVARSPTSACGMSGP